MSFADVNWPGDLNNLAVIYFDEATPPLRRDEAWRRMEVEIRNLAGSILYSRFARLWKQIRTDLIDESPNEVASRHRNYDPSLPYGPWCRTVLTRWFSDQNKKKRPAPLPKDSDSERDFDPSDFASSQVETPDYHPCDRTTPGFLEFFGKPFPNADLERMERWESDIRTVFLVKSRWWSKLSEIRRNEWLGELPLIDLAKADDTELATACGMGVPKFRRLWSENHYRVYLLYALQDIIDFPRAGPLFFRQLFDKARIHYGCLDSQVPVPFPHDELKELATPDPRAKFPGTLFLLAISGLYPRVPGEVWNQWLERDDLTPPFPPPDFRADDDESTKFRQLAPILNETETTLSNHWQKRCRNLLEGLKSLKTLIQWRTGNDEPVTNLWMED